MSEYASRPFGLRSLSHVARFRSGFLQPEIRISPSGALKREAALASGGYEVEIAHPALGAAPPKRERVFVCAESEDQACALVRTALRLSDEPVSVIRTLAEAESKGMGLKPFQVRQAPAKMKPVEETIREARKRGDEQ